ncbi:uncharacterized protein LOC129813045 [Salvelinus fontinalis]|uniref:uncharacterized protein LOC129813045 n=1 Tax=Salvelinus fontinalis TaxID=8038 RepID=UPI0024866674|nr:uncharacterized protein LOC129813045 [Salvelinus fontinalis]
MSHWEKYMSKVRSKQGGGRGRGHTLPLPQVLLQRSPVCVPRSLVRRRHGLRRGLLPTHQEDFYPAGGHTHTHARTHYDNILMEDTAQILAIETCIPLLLQNPEDGYSRLEALDHDRRPPAAAPVIKNMAFQKYSNMEQSLFTRFVHLGEPTVDLDDQGRARASLCNLYNWRYKQLENLPHVQLLPQFQAPNPGLIFDFQLLNVEDFNGVGESEPNPYFYQSTVWICSCTCVCCVTLPTGSASSPPTIDRNTSSETSSTSAVLGTPSLDSPTRYPDMWYIVQAYFSASSKSLKFHSHLQIFTTLISCRCQVASQLPITKHLFTD